MDLGEIRFAVSPLNELTLSLRTIRDPGRYPLHLPWLRATEPARASLDHELLLALSNDRLWTPDYLTPRPHSPLADVADELAAAGEVPARVVREDLGEIHPDGLPPVLTGRTDRLARRITRALHDYWEACFAPWWPRMRGGPAGRHRAARAPHRPARPRRHVRQPVEPDHPGRQRGPGQAGQQPELPPHDRLRRAHPGADPLLAARHRAHLTRRAPRS